MPAKSAPPPDPRAPLSRERVMQSAIALADAEGIESMSMRRLAHALGVEAMSLYYYVKRKDDILAGMLDAVFDEMERPAGEGDWRAAMRASAISAHHVLLRHPWACQLLMSPTGTSLAQLQWMNSILGRLRQAGFSAEATHHAYHALDSHIVGFTLWVLPYLAMARQRPDLAQAFLAEIPLDGLPHLAEHIEHHIAVDQPADTSEFDFGLDLILDGLERLRVANQRP